MRALMASNRIDCALRLGGFGVGFQPSIATGIQIVEISFTSMDGVNELESALIAEVILKAMAAGALTISEFAQMLADAGVANIAGKLALALLPVPAKIVIRRAPLAPI